MHIVFCFFFVYDEYHYGGRDWSTGYTWDVSLSEQMKYEEELEKQIFSEKKKKFYLIVYVKF